MTRLSELRLTSALAVAITGLSCLTPAQAEPAYEPMANYHASSIFAQVGQPVGRLKIKTDKGSFHCTGFLISTNHVMTNDHCVDDKWPNRKTKKTINRNVQAISFELGYVDATNKTTVKIYTVKLPALERSKALDYAILEVEGNPAEHFGYLAIAASTLMVKMPLWIIGHPRGKPQQISRIQCLSVTPIQKARNRLQHTCPAMPGSSGSPVFDASTGQVIAIHHAAYTTKSKKKIGLAVPLADIANQSKLLRDIINTQ